MTAVYCDPGVMRFIPGGAVGPDAVRGIIEGHLTANDAGLGFYALEERESGRLVGEVGFGVFATGEREIGWTIARAFWDRGYATEAVRACLAHDDPVVAAIDAENAASIRVAEKVGLTKREERVLHGRPHLVYESRPTLGR